jgi:hypothetical protein
MKTPTNFRYLLPITPHRIQLHVITRRERSDIGDLIATTALKGPLTIVAGSEWLPTYEVPRMLVRHTNAVREILNHIHLARAFTCYQMQDILEHTPPDREPLLLVNFLHAFEDENIAEEIRTRVLEACIEQLKILSISRPIAILIQHRLTSEYDRFYPLLEAIAHEIINAEAQAAVIPVPRLF